MGETQCQWLNKDPKRKCIEQNKTFRKFSMKKNLILKLMEIKKKKKQTDITI